MVTTSDNSYRPPVESNKAGAEADAEVKAFRWRSIPAGLSWCVSLLLGVGSIFWLGALCVAIYEHSDDDLGNFHIAAVYMATALLTASVLHFISGRKWVAGKWGTAILLNAASLGVFPGTGVVLEPYLIP
jgi:hypothetical protein